MPDILEVIGSETRWKILESLMKEPKDLKELASELGITVQGTMKHLSILEKSGLVKVSATKEHRQKYSIRGGVWMQKESSAEHELIFFFSSSLVKQESISSAPVRFRMHRMVRRAANYLLKKGSSDTTLHRSEPPGLAAES